MRRHLLIPDTQIEPGQPVDHIKWASEAIVDYMPDVIVMIGDWATMPSLSSYDKPGSIKLEGARIKDDIDVANAAAKVLVAPMEMEIERRKRRKIKQWNPQRIFCKGNHEQRLDRVAANDAKFEGVLSSDMIVLSGFETHEFLEIVEVDGVSYSHYFANTHSGKAIGGSIDNRLNKIGRSFVQGHQQGLLYGIRQFPGEMTRHGLVAGSFYLHDEEYRGAQSNGEWRGIVVLNEVKEGSYDVMPLSMEYLRRKYG
jgi:hypothetical protein